MNIKLVYVYDLEVDEGFDFEHYLKQPEHKPVTMWGEGVTMWNDTQAYVEQPVVVEYEY